MSTQMNGGGYMGGAVPIQIPQGAQQAPYGVAVPAAGTYQPQPVMPTGQQVINGNAGYSYGIDQLPPAPQPQTPQPFMGAQGNYGLSPQWNGQGQPNGQQPSQGGYTSNLGGYPQQFVPHTGSPQQFVPPAAGAYQPQQPSQQNGTPQLGLNTRLDGPAVPQALRGRTLGEALTIYSALEGSWAQRNGAAPTPAQQSLSQMQPPQGQAPVHQPPQGQVPNAQGQVSPWTNPEQFFGGLLEKKLEERLGPVIQHTQQQAVAQAYTMAKAGVVDFAALEPDLMQMLAGADPKTLTDPSTWIGAADIIRGRQMREGRYQQPPANRLGVAQVQIPGQPYAGNPAQMPGQPAGQGGQVPAYSFFTETPSAPSVSQFGGNLPGQPSQQDYQMADKFRMPIQDYMAWKVGVTQAPAGNGNGQYAAVGGAR